MDTGRRPPLTPFLAIVAALVLAGFVWLHVAAGLRARHADATARPATRASTPVPTHADGATTGPAHGAAHPPQEQL